MGFKQFMSGLLKKEPIPVSKKTPTIEEHEEAMLDFDDTISRFKQLSPKAQSTFLYRIVGMLPKPVAITFYNYLSKRLYGQDSIIRPKRNYPGGKDQRGKRPISKS